MSPAESSAGSSPGSLLSAIDRQIELTVGGNRIGAGSAQCRQYEEHTVWVARPRFDIDRRQIGEADRVVRSIGDIAIEVDFIVAGKSAYLRRGRRAGTCQKRTAGTDVGRQDGHARFPSDTGGATPPPGLVAGRSLMVRGDGVGGPERAERESERQNKRLERALIMRSSLLQSVVRDLTGRNTRSCRIRCPQQRGRRSWFRGS